MTNPIHVNAPTAMPKDEDKVEMYTKKSALEPLKTKAIGLGAPQQDTIKSILRKSALTAGYDITPQTQTDGGALKVESLDPEIKNLTWGVNDFTIYPQLVAKASLHANSTVEKYIRFTSHGRVGHRMFTPEIGLAQVNSPHLDQRTVNMKYITDPRQQSIATQFTSAVADYEELNERDAIASIGKTIEWALFYGDADLTDGTKGQGNGLEFDGLSKLIDDRNHLDLRGQSLTPEVLNQAAVIVKQAFGTPTDAYMPVGVLADFSNQFLGAQRLLMPTVDGMTAGTNVDKFISAGGTIKLNGSTVMDIDNVLDEDQKFSNAQAPSQPTVTATVNHAAGGEWLDAVTDKTQLDSTGNPIVIQESEINVPQTYKVVAVGEQGDSLASDPVSATPTAKDDTITLTITPAAIASVNPDYMAIYRQGPRTGAYYLVGRVPFSALADDGTLSFTDVNARIPETADVFIGQMDPTVIGLYQFIPLSRINLATVNTATQFTLLWSGALALFNPRRWVMLTNVRYNLYAPSNENHMYGVKANFWG